MENKYVRKFPNGIEMECYVHEVIGYRYNWHHDMYEINIVLNGSMEFYRGGEIYRLHKDDIILIDPGVGHASFTLEPNTIKLVIHFSARAFRAILPKGNICKFNYVTNESNRSLSINRQFRFYCAQVARCLGDESATVETVVRGAMALLTAHMLDEFSPIITKDIDCPSDAAVEKIMKRILRYIESNYSSKLSLENLAQEFGYNRTYISSFFKKYIGIGFYDYLTKLRFQHAVWDLAISDQNLTQIALQNGFPDLKTFNRMFRENFQILPNEYRKRLEGITCPKEFSAGPYLDINMTELQNTLQSYLNI